MTLSLMSPLSFTYLAARKRSMRNVFCLAGTMPRSTYDLQAMQDLKAFDQYPHGLTRLSEPSTSMQNTINRLGHVSFEDFQPSKFVKPQSIYYHLDGEQRRWYASEPAPDKRTPTFLCGCSKDVVEAHDSIAIILYHTRLDSLLLVRQFRPALYAKCIRDADQHGADINIPLAQGFACELCAGIVDKVKSLEEIAKEEVLEECGYDIPLSSIRNLTSFAASIGVQGSTQSLFFAEVDESMKVGGGGGLHVDGERIELVALPLDRVEAFVMDSTVPKTSGAMFGLIWGKQIAQASRKV